MTSSSSSEREQRATNRRKKLESSLVSSGSHVSKPTSSRPRSKLYKKIKSMERYHAHKAALAEAEKTQRALEEELFERLPDRDASVPAFVERPFGKVVPRGELVRYKICAGGTQDLSQLVVSLALFDGDKMLFACSGIPVSVGSSQVQLTRIVTSARLVTAYNNNRNRDDKLRIQVRYPDNSITGGFLGLYDDCIAIVTTLGIPIVYSIERDLEAQTLQSASCGEPIITAGRAFKSGSLMKMDGHVSLDDELKWVSDNNHIIKEAALGGPLIGHDDGRFLGMNVYDYGRSPNGDTYSFFISREFLLKRLKHFEILNRKKLDFRGYSLPEGVSAIVSPGFVATINRLRSLGYPIPPPLVLEFNGELLNIFEDFFGEFRAWEGYDLGIKPPGSAERGVWKLLRKKAVSDISRRVVLLTSFKVLPDSVARARSFVCAGLFIKWHGSRGTRSVILTSASLVRSKDGIDKNLEIDAFLPPKQRASGKLEFYNSNYNIAIVSVEKSFRGIRPEDIFNTAQRSSKKVVSIGREAKFGVLMASLGEVKRRNKGSKLDCRDLKLSTCKINKVGIGGPLINFGGNLVGMNFYDGRKETPFLPRSKIVNVLKRKIGLPLPSERGLDSPAAIEGTWKENRWPVPEPYWHNDLLEAEKWSVPKLRGRSLQ